MAITFLDGFDAYTNRQDATAGKWNIGSFANNGSITTGRLGAYAANIGSDTLGRAFTATTDAFVGMALNFSYYGLFGTTVLTFYDAASSVQITLNVDTFGRLGVYRAGNALLGITTNFLPLNTWQFLEFGVHIGNGTSGSFIVRVNNQIILQNTACDTQATSDTTVSAVQVSAGSGAGLYIDDLYITDGTGSVNNYFLGDLRIETLFPDSDVTADLTPINMMGNSNLGYTGSQVLFPSANTLYLLRVQCDTSGTVSIGLLNPDMTSTTAKSKMVIYTDNAGLVGTLVATSDERVGCVNGTQVLYPFSTPPTVTVSTIYWIGLISDTSFWLYANPFTRTGISANLANAYSSGAPSGPTGFSYGTDNPQFAIQITSGTNFSAVNEPQEDADYSYVSSNNPGDTDLYTYQDLTADSQTVYGVQLSPMIRKTHTANRTATVQIKTPSMTTASSGTIAPGVNYAYYPQVFNYQSDGTTTWTVAAVNGIEGGITVG